MIAAGVDDFFFDDALSPLRRYLLFAMMFADLSRSFFILLFDARHFLTPSLCAALSMSILSIFSLRH